MGKMLEYLGYHASVEFDAEDMLLEGSVFGITDSLNFYGTTVPEVEEMFHQSIDNYLAMCKERGKEPDKEFKGSFNVRISPELHKMAALAAEEKKISLNQFVTEALEAKLYHVVERETIVVPAEFMTEMLRAKKSEKDYAKVGGVIQTSGVISLE